MLLAADALQVGAVYFEEDIGSDLHGDLLQISFAGGAANTQLTRVIINGDRDDNGFSLGDVFFDTTSAGYGADGHFEIEVISRAGIDNVRWSVIDGTSLLVFDFEGFDAGETFAFSIDVDELQEYDPNEPDIHRANEGIDPITSGVEFQGSHLTAHFSAPHYFDITADGEFRNRYDDALTASGLSLPEDNFNGKRDRSAGAFGTAQQLPLPISISGTVYVDIDLDRLQDSNEQGLANVSLELWVLSDGIYRSTGFSTTTDSLGNYRFGTDLELLPGTYQIRESQPAGYFSVAAIPGTVAGTPSGEAAAGNPDILTSVSIPLGNQHAIDYDFAEALPAAISGYVYHDRDNDGRRDAGEEGIGGSQITVIPISTVAAQSTIVVTTDANGHYQVTGLAPGTYRVVQSVQPVGYFDGLDAAGTVDGTTIGSAVNPGDAINSILLNGGKQGIEYNFGELAPVSIQGRVHLSTADGDCFSTSVTHEPVAGAVVRLLDDSGNVVAQTVSDANGEYWFRDLHPGRYSVEEVTPAGLIDGGAKAGTVAGRPVGVVRAGGVLASIELGSGQVAIDYDFCEHRPASLAGKVYHDRDDDGIAEANEPGIAGVRVVLLNAAGEVVAEQVTSNNGNYRFENLRAGTYVVEERHPSEWVDGKDAAGRIGGVVVGQALNPGDRIRDILLRWGDNGVDYNFGEILTASIQGRVQLSTSDGDCFGESGQHAPVVGAIVRLLNDQGVVIAETTTDANGEYSFEGLRPGTYTVVEQTPADYFDGGARAGTINGQPRGVVADSGTIRDIALLSGHSAVNYDFCEHAPANLAGNVFHDRDDDGRRETGEEGIANVLVILRDEAGNIVDQQFTDNAGRYRFTRLRAGNYSIVEQQPDGWIDGKDRAGRVDGSPVGQATNPGDLIRNVALGWGTSGVDYDFGEIREASISGTVHLSRSEEDCFSEAANKGPIVGAVVELYDSNGQRIATTTTDTNGNYQFVGLRPGTYSVVEITPVGLFDGDAHAGTVGGERRGVVDADGSIRSILLSSGQQGVDYDFCEFEPATIAGHVYHDADENGQRGLNEQPIPNVEVLLRNATGTIVARTTTDATGAYRFTNLRAGTYTITESQPNGWLDGADRAGEINGATVGAADTTGDAIRGIRLEFGDNGVNYDFGELLPGSISGLVHSEIDLINCRFEPQLGELALSNVTVDLYEVIESTGGGRTERLVATTRTDVNGRYRFDGLRAGNYLVREHQPVEYFDGKVSAGSAGGNTSVANEISQLIIHSGDSLVDYNFCEATPVTLSGYVFLDGPPVLLQPNATLPERIADVRDGQRSNDDIPLAGIVLQLRQGINGTPLVAGVDALPGHYSDGTFTVVTDASGYYEFTGLRHGTYAVFQTHPDEFIDGVDTPGSEQGYVFNPGEPVNQVVLRQLETDPRNDAIVQVTLPPGRRSIENNFSEVRVERVTVLVPLDPPPTKPPLPPLEPPVFPDILSPAVPRRPYRRDDLAPLSTAAPGNTWHLSVIDAGKPRGEGIVLRNGTSVWLAAMQLPPGNLERFNRGSWTFETDRIGAAAKHGNLFTLGVVGAIPVAGDFNGDGHDEIGVYYQGHWFIDVNGNGIWDAEDLWAKLGGAFDLPVTGDWDGDGKDDIGIYGRSWHGDPRAIAVEPGLPDNDNPPSGQRKNFPPAENEAPPRRRIMQLTAQGDMRADVIDHVFHYGVEGDRPVVGDWNGDGIQSIGVFRDGQWRLDMDADGRWSEADKYLKYGQPGDIPVVGDFNGDGVDELGLFRNGRFYLDTNGNGEVDAGDRQFSLGAPGDHPAVGDWNGDGIEEVTVYRSATEPIREAGTMKKAG